jgi:hypothetical protein
MSEGVWANRLRTRALAFQDGVRSIGMTQVCKSPAEQAHHHGFDHTQSEQRGHSCVYCVATGAQHF